MGTVKVEHKITVADVDEDGFLGFDFLHKYQCELNLKSKRLIVNSPIEQQQTHDDLKCYRVAVNETTVIPPNSEKMVVSKMS